MRSARMPPSARRVARALEHVAEEDDEAGLIGEIGAIGIEAEERGLAAGVRERGHERAVIGLDERARLGARDRPHRGDVDGGERHEAEARVVVLPAHDAGVLGAAAPSATPKSVARSSGASAIASPCGARRGRLAGVDEDAVEVFFRSGLAARSARDGERGLEELDVAVGEEHAAHGRQARSPTRKTGSRRAPGLGATTRSSSESASSRAAAT
jgi:hypothetical protein